jgi:hypothetical protein
MEMSIFIYLYGANLYICILFILNMIKTAFVQKGKKDTVSIRLKCREMSFIDLYYFSDIVINYDWWDK